MLSFPDFKEKKIIIIFPKDGEKLSFKNDNLVVKDGDNKIVLQTTCYTILALWIMGDTVITTGLLSRSKKFAFPVYQLSYNHRLVGFWNASIEGNVLLRKKQYDYSGLHIAKKIVHNKLHNQTAQLQSIRKKDEMVKDTISALKKYQYEIDRMNKVQQLMGIEGVATRIYFQTWFINMSWQARRPRTKFDRINLLMDMGYTYLFYFIENMLNLYGFDTYVGVLHRNFYQRKSLVCDIVEPFRCIIDKTIKKAFNLGQINEEDFTFKQERYTLSFKKAKPYTQWLMEGLLKYKSDIFIYCQEYYRAFVRDKSIEEYPFFDMSHPR